MNNFISKLTHFVETMPIAKKIRLTFLPVMVFAIFLASILVIENIQSISSASTSKNSIELMKHLDALAHNFAVERGITAGYLGSKGASGMDKLRDQRKLADLMAQNLQAYLESNADDFDEQTNLMLSELSNLITKVPSLRDKVNDLRKDSNAFSMYSSINKKALDTIAILANKTTDIDVSNSLNALKDGLWLKERAGQERGLVNGVFSRASYTTNNIADIKLYIADQAIRIENVSRSLSQEKRIEFTQFEATDASKKVESSRDSLFKAVENNTPVQESASEWFAQSTARIKAIKQQTDTLQQQTIEIAHAIYVKSWVILIVLVIFLGGMISAIIYFSNLVISLILTRLSLLTGLLSKVQNTMDFSHRIDEKFDDNADEIGQACIETNSLLEEISNTIGDVCTTMERIGNGEFSARLELELKGDLNRLKAGINNSAAKVDTTMKSLGDVMDALHQGDFSARMSSSVEGEFKTRVDQAMSLTNEAFSEIMDVMNSVSQGDFSKRVSQPCNGQLDSLKTSINSSVDSISTALNEIKMVVTEQQTGNFKAKIDGDYQGELLLVKNFTNSSMESIDQALNAIGDVFTRLRQGDFSGHIELDLKGQLSEMKGDINSSMIILQQAMKEISSVLDSQQNGDLTARMQGSYGGDLKDISASINHGMANLEGIVRNIKDSSDHATNTSKELLMAINDLARRTESQAASLEEITSSIAVITDLTSESDSKVRNVTIEIASVATETQASLKTVNETINAMDSMRVSSQEITSITNMISEIAFQTNLLALNAAVEAARAGDQGRGFSVVAGEVRNLSQRSAQATRDIKQLVDKNLSLVESCSDLTNQSSENLSSISSRVITAKEYTDLASSASKEQSTGVYGIKSAIGTIDNMTQENAAMVEQATAATMSVSEQSVSVNKLLGFFKIS